MSNTSQSELTLPAALIIMDGFGLADAGQAPFFLPGRLKGVADDPLAAGPGKHAVLDHHLIGLSLKQPASAARILSLAVFPDKGHMDILPGRIL